MSSSKINHYIETASILVTYELVVDDAIHTFQIIHICSNYGGFFLTFWPRFYIWKNFIRVMKYGSGE